MAIIDVRSHTETVTVNTEIEKDVRKVTPSVSRTMKLEKANN